MGDLGPVAQGAGRRRNRQPQAETEKDAGNETASSNTCSTHGTMMPEHLFTVKTGTEHMFATPPGPC